MKKSTYERIKEVQLTIDRRLDGKEEFYGAHGVLRDVVTNMYAVVSDVGVQYVSNTSCYADLYDLNLPSGSEFYVVSSLVNAKDKLPKHKITEFLEWVVKRSPYASIFASKNVSRIYESGFVLVKTDVPSNLMVGGLVLLRALHETTSIVKAWYNLVEIGCNENLAYLMGNCVFYGESGSVSATPFPPYHSLLGGVKIRGGFVKNFITNNPVSLAEKYNTARVYKHLIKCWVSCDVGWTLYDKIVEKIAAAEKSNTKNLFKVDIKEVFTADSANTLLKELNDEILEEFYERPNS